MRGKYYRDFYTIPVLTFAVKAKLSLGAVCAGCGHTVLHERFLALTEITRLVVSDVRELGQVESGAFLTANVRVVYRHSCHRGDVTGTSGDCLDIGRGIGKPVRRILVDIIRGGTWRW